MAEMPFYPPIGRASSLQGVVMLEVTTEGDKANSINITSDPKLLADASTSNLRGWRFVGKPPETFRVTYRYRLSTSCKELLILVAPPGLEPGLSALKGPRVNQLHHGAVQKIG
jgi:hypothetical protein